MHRVIGFLGTFQFQLPGRSIMGLRHFNLVDVKHGSTRTKVTSAPCGVIVCALP